MLPAKSKPTLPDLPTLDELKMRAHELVDEIEAKGISKSDIYWKLRLLLNSSKKVHFADMCTISQVQRGIGALEEIKYCHARNIKYRNDLRQCITSVNNLEMEIDTAVRILKGRSKSEEQIRFKLLKHLNPEAIAKWEEKKKNDRSVALEKQRLQEEHIRIKKETKLRSETAKVTNEIPREKLKTIYEELKIRNSQGNDRISI